MMHAASLTSDETQHVTRTDTPLGPGRADLTPNVQTQIAVGNSRKLHELDRRHRRELVIFWPRRFGSGLD